MSLPTTRAEAAAKHLTRYYTGKPCQKGHLSHRYTKSGSCAKCRSDAGAALWKAGLRPKPEARKTGDKNWNASQKARDAKQRWKEKDPKRAWCVSATGSAKARAAVKRVPFSITAAYIYSITSDTCPVFGEPFVFIGKKMSGASATIDRIDPEKGYVEGNVAVISAKANTIKSAYTSSDLMKVADWLKNRGY